MQFMKFCLPAIGNTELNDGVSGTRQYAPRFVARDLAAEGIEEARIGHEPEGMTVSKLAQQRKVVACKSPRTKTNCEGKRNLWL
jgi:hypothetical protein